MTTTYKNIAYETTEALRDALNTELSNLDYPYPVTHRINGQGQLVFVKAPLTGGSLYATIDFDSIGTKLIALDVAFSIRVLTMPEILTDILLEAQTAFKEDFVTRDQAKREAERLAREQERAAAKKADEEKRAEAKYQAAKAKAIKEFRDWVQTERPQSTADEFYYALGWLVKHTGTVSAVVPDYLADEFKGYFGPETPCRITDSKKKGPAGWTSQWAKSYAVSLKKPEGMPVLLTKYLNPKGTALSDSDFVLELIDNYGFQFGKTQDVEKIRACVPTAHISFFENGLV